MRTRYGQSPWITGVPASRRPSSPRLRGEHESSVVIVGGGLTGCTAAYLCAAAGLTVTLLEAGRIGQGRTGHSAGLLLPEPGVSFGECTAQHGLRAARHTFEAWRRAALDAAALLRRLGWRTRIEPLDSMLVAAPGDERALRREVDARKAAGLPVSWLGATAARGATSLDTAGALRVHDAFGLDPYRACVTLATAAAERGATLFEGTRVTRVDVRPHHIDVVADGGAVRAERVLVATGVPAAPFTPLQRHFTPHESYLVLSEPMPAAMRRAANHPGLTLADTRDPPHRLRWMRGHRVLVGGADQDQPPARGRDATLVQRTGQLMYELLTMYPAISGLRPEFGWSVPYGRTADGLPYIGPHRNYPRHLFALGGGGSLTSAFLAGRLLLRALRGEPDRSDAVFGFTR